MYISVYDQSFRDFSKFVVVANGGQNNYLLLFNFVAQQPYREIKALILNVKTATNICSSVKFSAYQ